MSQEGMKQQQLGRNLEAFHLENHMFISLDQLERASLQRLKLND